MLSLQKIFFVISDVIKTLKILLTDILLFNFIIMADRFVWLSKGLIEV